MMSLRSVGTFTLFDVIIIVCALTFTPMTMQSGPSAPNYHEIADRMISAVVPDAHVNGLAIEREELKARIASILPEVKGGWSIDQDVFTAFRGITKEITDFAKAVDGVNVPANSVVLDIVEDHAEPLLEQRIKIEKTTGDVNTGSAERVFATADSTKDPANERGNKWMPLDMRIDEML